MKLTWEDCYDGSWRDLIMPEAFAHPAKFSPSLVRRIYAHGLKAGWWKPGDLIGDPFGGIAGGGIMAGYAGLNWIGVELEPRFVALGNQNLAMHGPKWAALGEANTVKLVQGDSRRFAEIVGQAAAVVTSPPFVDCDTKPTKLGTGKATRADGDGAGRNKGDYIYGESDGQIGTLKAGDVDAVITSPPFLAARSNTTSNSGGIQKNGLHNGDRVGDRTYLAGADERGPDNIETLPPGNLDAVLTSPPYISGGHHADQTGSWGGLATQKGLGTKEVAGYGKTDGQIGQLKPGEIDAVVTSPPYADSVNSANHGIDWTKVGSSSAGRKRGDECKHGQTLRAQLAYGSEDGQIGALSSGSIDAVVTSPPFGDEQPCASQTRARKDYHDFTRGDSGKRDQIQRSEGNIATLGAGETYWQAMHAVYAQCLLALKPGGVMAVVLKDYVKDKQRVPLCDQSMRLLEHLGFEPVCRIHAMLVKSRTHAGLFHDHTETRERKSFFRRLAEKKGSPRIDYEEVLVVRKPPSPSSSALPETARHRGKGASRA